MKLMNIRLFSIAIILLLLGACTKETTKREPYVPNIGTYGLWKTVYFADLDGIRDIKFVQFTTKKTMFVYQQVEGFNFGFSKDFLATESDLVTDIYNNSTPVIMSYSMKGDTLILSSGGTILLKGLKAPESDIANWSQDISYSDAILGVLAGRSYGLGFDGTNLLSPEYNGQRITRVSLSTRLIKDNIFISSYPYTVEFDGTDIWVSNDGSSEINKYTMAGGSSIASITVGPWVYGIAYDPAGATVIAYSAATDSLYFCNTSTNKVQSTKYIGSGFTDLAWANGKLFLAKGNFIYKFDTGTNTVEKAYKLKSGEEIYGIAAVGNDFWLYTSGDKMLKVTLN